MALKGCVKAARWSCRDRTAEKAITAVTHKGLTDEFFPHLHHAADCDYAAYDRNCPGRRCCISAVAGIGPATGGLPDYSGPDFLPRGQFRSYGHIRDSPAGEAVRPDARTDPDDVRKLGRQFGNYSAV